jgi:hypothetical protein
MNTGAMVDFIHYSIIIKGTDGRPHQEKPPGFGERRQRTRRRKAGAKSGHKGTGGNTAIPVIHGES